MNGLRAARCPVASFVERTGDVMKVWMTRALFALLGLPLLFAGIMGGPAHASADMRVGVFSWSVENILEAEARELLFNTLIEINAVEVYQSFHRDDTLDFLLEAHERGILVYALAGQPEWGLDPQAKKMINEVNLVVALREKLGEAGPAGLMLDVEPYLTKAYRDDPERAMDAFVAAMRRTYDYAGDAGVEIIICIPYFIDSKGFPNHLRALIEEASDAVAVMNYLKKSEWANIETEVSIAREAGKRVINIAELQRPGMYDLTDRNTYYGEGLSAVWRSFDKLKNEFEYERLSFALHEYTALREVINNE